MPPPRTGGSPDPLDPFPPLLSRRRPTVTVPTYASILRPHVTAARAGETGVWGAEDVDPADALDEIRSIPSDPVTAAPWRQQAGEPSEREEEGQGTRARPIEVGLGRLPEPAERNPEVPGSVIAPGSAHRPGASSTTRLAPIFTLDELLGGPSTSAAAGPSGEERRPTLSPSPRSDPPAARPAAALRTAAAASSGSRLASEFEHARRTWQGGIEAASRLGYDPAASAGPSGSSAPRGGGIGRVGGRQVDTGSSNINEPDPGAIPLRRRSRRVFPPGLGPSLGPVLNRDGTYGLGDDDVWSQFANQHEYYDEMDLDDEDEDNEHDPEHDMDRLEQALRARDANSGAGAPRRTTRPFYSHPNLTGDIDLTEWTSAFTPALRRGGNNRRRDSLQQRIDPDRPDAGGASHGAEVMPLLADLPQGMDPTNTDTRLATQPVIVRTSGNRRQRSLSEGSVPEKQRSQTIKRRRMPATQANPPARPEYLSLTSLRHSTPLPNDFTRPHSLSFLHLSHSTTGRPIIKFCDGPRVTGKDEDASALRANRPIPVECGVHYYEVECINAGHKGYMSVGWMTKSTKLNRLVGWDKGAWGWHADDGMSFNQNGTGQQFAERWSTGDMVGCGIDFTTGRAFFTKNGRLMGHRFSDLGAGLYPAIGLNTRDEELCVNFTGPFRFDIAAYVREARDNIEVDIARQQITEIPCISGPSSAIQPSSDETTEAKLEDVTMKDDTVADPSAAPRLVPNSSPLQPAGPRTTAAFVLDYLRYHGHTTALDSTRAEMVRRKWLPDSAPSTTASAGASDKLATINDIARQLALPKSLIPIDLIDSLLPATSHLHHRMSIYQLVHLVQRATEERDEEGELDAIAYGRQLRQRAKEQPWARPEVALLEEAVGTVALGLNDVERARWAQRRDRDAERLDRHLRSMSDLPVHPRLVDALVQTRINTDHLARNGHPAATFLDIRRALKLDTSPTSSK